MFDVLIILSCLSWAVVWAEPQESFMKPSRRYAISCLCRFCSSQYETQARQKNKIYTTLAKQVIFNYASLFSTPMKKNFGVLFYCQEIENKTWDSFASISTIILLTYVPPTPTKSVWAFFKYLSLPSSCVCKRACTYLKVKSEVPVRVFLRPLGTSGFCYALCDPSMAVLCPCPPSPSPTLWEGRVMTQCGWLHFPGLLLLVRLSTPLLRAGDGLQPTALLFC